MWFLTDSIVASAYVIRTTSSVAIAAVGAIGGGDGENRGEKEHDHHVQ